MPVPGPAASGSLPPPSPPPMFGEGGLQALREALEQAAAAVDGGPAPQAVAGLPGFVEAEVADLHRSLRG